MSIIADAGAFTDELTNPTLKSLVSLCGIEDGIGKDMEEGERLTLLKVQLAVVQRRPRPVQDQIFYEIAAKHLPAIVEKFRSSEGAQNAAMALINITSYTPHFVRFTRLPSQQPSAEPTIAAVQVHRWAELVRANPISFAADEIAEIGQFSATLMLLQGTEGISEEDKQTLLPKLRGCEKYHDGKLAGSVSEKCISLLENNRLIIAMMQPVIRMLEGPLIQCGDPQCGLTKAMSSGENLMRCARCRTAVYCGFAHQKSAWSRHKKLCFAPAF